MQLPSSSSFLFLLSLFQSPYGEIGNATYWDIVVPDELRDKMFQSPYGEIGNATEELTMKKLYVLKVFQSPYGEIGNATS